MWGGKKMQLYRSRSGHAARVRELAHGSRHCWGALSDIVCFLYRLDLMLINESSCLRSSTVFFSFQNVSPSFLPSLVVSSLGSYFLNSRGTWSRLNACGRASSWILDLSLTGAAINNVFTGTEWKQHLGFTGIHFNMRISKSVHAGESFPNSD